MNYQLSVFIASQERNFVLVIPSLECAFTSVYLLRCTYLGLFIVTLTWCIYLVERTRAWWYLATTTYNPPRWQTLRGGGHDKEDASVGTYNRQICMYFCYSLRVVSANGVNFMKLQDVITLHKNPPHRVWKRGGLYE